MTGEMTPLIAPIRDDSNTVTTPVTHVVLADVGKRFTRTPPAAVITVCYGKEQGDVREFPAALSSEPSPAGGSATRHVMS